MRDLARLFLAVVLVFGVGLLGFGLWDNHDRQQTKVDWARYDDLSEKPHLTHVEQLELDQLKEKLHMNDK